MGFRRLVPTCCIKKSKEKKSGCAVIFLLFSVYSLSSSTFYEMENMIARDRKL